MDNPGTLNRVSSFQILNVKIFLIRKDPGYLLVDAGIPGQESRIDAAFQAWGVDPREVTHIILTHGHLDHIGCLAYAREITGAKVICHQSIADLLASGKYEEAVPRVWYWKILNLPISRIIGANLNPISPDIVLDGEFNLGEIGIPGRIIHTPGHSPGSCSIFLESGEALIGDLVRDNRKGGIDTGLFYDDWDRIFRSLWEVLSLNPETIHLSHGGMISCEILNGFYKDNSA